MKRYMYALGGIIAAIVLIIAAIFVGKKVLSNAPENRETVPYSHENGETNASGEQLEGMPVISAEEDFKITREFDDGYVNIAIKNPPQEPYILKVPAILDGKTVHMMDEIVNDFYVYEIVFQNEESTTNIIGCDNLRKITYPQGATRIAAITNCKRLTEIVFPENEDFNNILAVGSLNSLQSIQLPASIIQVQSCFNICPRLVAIELPQNLQIISASFLNCPVLKYVDIPDSVTEIDSSFFECPELTLYVGRGTVAERYAKENNIPYEYHGKGVEMPSVEIPPLDDIGSGKYLTYAVMPGSALWIRSSHTELMQMLQVSMEDTEQYTTKELLELCIQYPFFGDFLAYDTIAEGVLMVTASHNYFQALLSKEDAASVAMDYYQSLNMSAWTMNSEFFFLRLQFVEALLAETGMLEGMTEETLQDLAKTALEYVQYMKEMGYTCPEGSILYQYIADILELSEGERVIKPVEIEEITVHSSRGNIDLSVVVYQKDYSIYARSEMDRYIQAAYPSAGKIEGAGMYANSHSYAGMIMYRNLIEQGWVSRKQVVEYYRSDAYHRAGTSTDQSLLNSDGDVYWYDVVVYQSHVHSARVMSSTLLQSKWGRYGVYNHTVTECPYDASALTFYR